MNHPASKKQNGEIKTKVRIITCAMHVTETVVIPIKETSLGQHQVTRSEHDLTLAKTFRSIFIAQALAEMKSFPVGKIKLVQNKVESSGLLEYAKKDLL